MTDLKDWAEELAAKYDISHITVLGVYSNLIGRLYDSGRFLNKRKRTELFFKLYFEVVKKEHENE